MNYIVLECKYRYLINSFTYRCTFCIDFDFFFLVIVIFEIGWSFLYCTNKKINAVFTELPEKSNCYVNIPKLEV